MKFIGNILWFFLTGFWSGMSFLLLGLIWCITVVGIPFGLQCFKIAGLMFWPFGKDISTHFDAHPFANIIWLALGGLALSVAFLAVGAVFCITVIGIPFGLQCFKLAKLSAVPFGADF